MVRLASYGSAMAVLPSSLVEELCDNLLMLLLILL
jgi:hypothetical protein